MFGFGQREVQDRFSLEALGKQYHFVPPRFGRFIPALLRRCLPYYMSRKYGIEQWEVRGSDLLKASINDANGIVLSPNHSRDSDSLGIGFIATKNKTPLHFMAGWHVLLESWFQHFIIPRAGGFSILREGNDRQSVRTAIDLVANAPRPLIIFPEGYVTRTNDKLGNLQEGVTLIARRAASQRSKNQNGSTVIHPVIIKYQFLGDLEKEVTPKFRLLEKKLCLPDNTSLDFVARLKQIREGIIKYREQKLDGKAFDGSLDERVPELIEALLKPLEKKWECTENSKDLYRRVQQLRTMILNHAVTSNTLKHKQDQMRSQLGDCTWALKLSNYNPDYVAEEPCIERVMETLDGFEEDVFSCIQVNRPWKMVIDIGKAIHVEPRDKSLGQQLKMAMTIQLSALSSELNQKF